MTTAIAPTIWPIALIASQFTSQIVPNYPAFRKRKSVRRRDDLARADFVTMHVIFCETLPQAS
jgi:hypothetical protein